MFNEITYFSNRRPVLFGIITIAVLTIIPWLAVCAVYAFLGEDFPITHILIAFSFVMQMILCCKIEKFVLTMIPFVVMLFGSLLCEWIYLASQVSVQSGQLSAAREGYELLSTATAVFAPEFFGVVIALVLYALCTVVRSFFG